METAPKKKMSKTMKLILCIGGGIIGLFVLLAIIGSIVIANQPGGWDAELESQDAITSEATSSKQAPKESEQGADASRFDASANAKESETAAQSSAAQQSNSKAEKPKSKAEPKKAGSKPVKDQRQAYADRSYKAWLANYGAESNADILRDLPGSVQGYLVSAESPTTGAVVFTAQLTENDVEKDELEQAAMAVLNLVGYEDETLDRVEIVTADSLERGVANRYDSPLLNQ